MEISAMVMDATGRIRAVLVAAVAVLWFAGADRASAGEPEWRDRWPTFRPVEGVATGILMGGNALNRWALEPPAEPNWTGPLPGYDPARRLLGVRDDGWRSGIGSLSDIALWTSVAYPVAVDSALVSGAVHRDGRLTAQTAAIGVQSLALANFASSLIKHVVARQRPPADCPGPSYCTERQNESFPSGHATLAFTGASLTCSFHEHVGLYGSKWADRAACWGAIGVAAFTGLCRVMSENHYLTDVLAGALVGFAAGYLVPNALHFEAGGGADSSPAGTTPADLRRVPAPSAPMFRYQFQF